MKKTKIICSIGPASSNPNTMCEMVKNGMNVARVNFSHATLEERQEAVSSVKKVREMTGENIAILYDTKGPEFRNGILENDEINLVEGKTIRIVKEKVLGNEERFSVNHPKAIDSINIGDRILLENGLMCIEVISKEEDGITCKIVVGGVLGNKKSLSVPGVHLDMPFVSEEDRQDIIYACEHDGDFLALSFVSSSEDVLEVNDLLINMGNDHLQIISKIENNYAVADIDNIIKVSDGIMIARGDLGAEIPLERIPGIQKKIISKCHSRGIISIVATELLSNMTNLDRPTRAEVSDIANAVLDGTDAVMLSGETTVGKYPVEALNMMEKIIKAAERDIDYNSVLQKSIQTEKRDVTGTLAYSVAGCALNLQCKAIFTPTMSGYTAKKISRFRPVCPIIAPSPNVGTVKSLALNFGVYPVLIDDLKSLDAIIEKSKKLAQEMLALTTKDNIIITGGYPFKKVKTTNFMKIEEI